MAFSLAAVAEAANAAPWWFPSETVQLAIVAGGGGVMSAVILAVTTYVISTRQKKADWARQDEVALRVEDARRKAEEAAKLLLASNERVARNAEDTTSKLDVIHELVNSGTTALMQTVLDSLQAQLVLLRRVPKSGEERDDAITIMEQRIKALTETVAERRRLEALSAETQKQQAEEVRNDKH